MNDSLKPIPGPERINPESKPVSQTVPQGEAPPTKPMNSIPVRKPRRFAFFTALQSIIGTSIIVATLFTLFSPRNIISGQMFNSIILALQSTPEVNINPTPIQNSQKPRIGIVAGHYGHDSGTVCKDGLTEASVNMTIATLVRQNLLRAGFQVDLLQEFDPNLNSYQALALISIHNDSCDYINDQATGYKVAAAQATRYPEKTSRLASCLIDRYGSITKLPFHANTITPDMSQYHAFDEISPSTPAVIIETGFMNLDRQILTQHSDVVAQGVTAGLLCFMNNEAIPTKEVPVK
jgi:N-acetylmuramoyl-L-alanine amidase